LLSGNGRLSIGPINPGIFDNLSTERVSTTDPGILIVYVDNQTMGKDVWFDNVQVLHYNTQVLEENHYYPFGLTVSTSAMGVTKQPYKYQGVELEKSFGLETYETAFRGLDPQLGRWNGIDIKSEKYYHLSPYASMGNNPVSFVDPLGDDTWVYGKNGVMLLQIEDNLPNQIHFINHEVPSDHVAGTVKGNDVAKGYREISYAFLGANSAKSLEKIAMKSASTGKDNYVSGLELGFYGEISETKEILFKEMDVPSNFKPFTNKVWDEKHYPMGAVVRSYSNTNTWAVYGHIHSPGWYRFGHQSEKETADGNYLGTGRRNVLEFYAKPSGNPGTDYVTGIVDYTPHIKRPIPLMIASPLGISIYSSQKLYETKDSRFYEWFKK